MLSLWTHALLQPAQLPQAFGSSLWGSVLSGTLMLGMQRGTERGQFLWLAEKSKKMEIRDIYQLWWWEGCWGLLLSFPIVVLLFSLGPHVANPTLPSGEQWLQAPSRAHWRNLGHSGKVVGKDLAHPCGAGAGICLPWCVRGWAGPKPSSLSLLQLWTPTAPTGMPAEKWMWWPHSRDIGGTLWDPPKHFLWMERSQWLKLLQSRWGAEPGFPA